MLQGLVSLLLTLNTGITPLESDRNAFNMADLLEVHPVPTQKPWTIAPVVDSKAALIMDLNTGILLYEKGAHEPLPMASLTKIMTAILILEDHTLNETVFVQRNFRELEGVKIGLTTGEELSVRELLTALLVRSSGDAAEALAEHHSGSVEAFVAKMNEKAIELGLKNTMFENPVGLDGETQYSTAFELAFLTRYALHFQEFRRIVQLPSATITSAAGTRYSFQNTNKLLGGYLDVRGVKTGTTDGAGPSLIGLVNGRNNQQVLAVSLNSPDRFGEMASMLDWALRSYQW